MLWNCYIYLKFMSERNLHFRFSLNELYSFSTSLNPTSRNRNAYNSTKYPKRIKMKIFKIYFFAVLISIPIAAQNDISNIPILKNTKVLNLYSTEVQDSFKIYIKLPEGYFASQKTYSVIYLLDGDILFPIACGNLQYLYYGEAAPEMIIVGIGYGGLGFDSGNNRSRDYTAIPIEGRSYWGGAPKFLNFIKNELIPKLESNFRVDDSERILMGHSLGGQFVLYSFFTQPELFTKYIASSPALFSLIEFYDQLEEKSVTKLNNLNRKIWISVGENELSEEYLTPLQNIANKIESRSYKNIGLRYEEISGGSHFLVPSIALSYGLKFLFEN